ncbi:MAG: Uma2 family endonuclease [Okeania sp. SIO3C4]|nr:Uma2 family endonuclease [Okeania sp. SIO3C4]
MLQLHVPKDYSLDSRTFQKMQWENPFLYLRKEGNAILMEENSIEFDKLNFVELTFPRVISEGLYLEIDELNPDLKKIEFHQNKLQIHMGTIAFISAFSVLVGFVIIQWNRKHKFGTAYDAQADFIIKDGGHKIPDIGLVKGRLIEHINEKGFIAGTPSLIVEVVSNKYALQQDLRKMAEHWMPNGTEIGLVIDPHRKEYHVFEQGEENYKSFPFETIFEHTKLPELELDFNALLVEARGEEE